MKNFSQKLRAYLILGAITYCLISFVNLEFKLTNWGVASRVIFVSGAIFGCVIFEHDKIF